MDELYKDLLNDSKNQRHFFMVIVAILIVVVMLSVGGMIALSVYNQNRLERMANTCNERLMSFISETDFYVDYDISTSDSSLNNGSISVTK